MTAPTDALRALIAEMLDAAGEMAADSFDATETVKRWAARLASLATPAGSASGEEVWEARLRCLVDHLCGDGPTVAMANAMLNESDVQLFAAIDAAIQGSANGQG